MGRWRVYIKPFDDTGEYQADYINVTDDVTGSPSSIKTNLDDTEFDVGVFRNSSLTIRLNNVSGKYSDVGQTGSIFKSTRNDSQVKITWALKPDITQCGFTICGADDALLTEEKTIFEGLLNDDSAKQDVFSQFVEFKVLGREDLFKRVIVPFASISNGDLTSEALFTMLNQAPITDILTVNALNITVDSDQTIDDKTDLEGETVFEAVSNFLQVSNSVLYIDSDGNIVITPRDATATVQYNFYGQASDIGIENIIAIKNVNNGSRRLFNYLQWGDTSTIRQDTTSIETYGTKKRSIEFSVFTTLSKQQSMLDAYVSEFAVPKQELDLTTPLNYGTVDLGLLDRVDIDYPASVTTENNPIIGVTAIGDAEFPLPGEQTAFTIDTLTNYKITSRTVDMKRDKITYHLRAI